MNISPIKRTKLKEEEWRVYTVHDLTQQSITEFLASQGEAEISTGEIFYNGEKILVYIVSFFVVEHLVTSNTTENKFQFVVYHREKGQTNWVRWKQERKTSQEKVRDLFRTKHVRPAL